ncbi:MAG: tyrosine-type recombinase/integrase, partial [Candidatus Thermoplasmatota archaeon]|nr:tyrosine-type recombinase/integrase [Candidatus Thermoplasmatota archaeon]
TLDQNPETVATQKMQLSKFLYYLKGKDPKKLTTEDLTNFLEGYKHGTQVNLIIILKPFYRWLFNVEENSDLPDFIKKLKRKNTKINETEYRERVVTAEEFDKMIECAPGPIYRAIIDTLYHFGVRISELLSMESQDVKYDGEITTITVRDSKSIPRDVDYKGRCEHLLKWAETLQPNKNQKGKPMWTGKIKDQLRRQTVWCNIVATAKKAGITRQITNHDFRHTSVTNDRNNGIPLTHIETKHGYAHRTPMMGRYDHNKTADYKAWLKQKKGETEVTYETLKKQKEQLQHQKDIEIETIKKQMEDDKLYYENEIGKLSQQLGNVTKLLDILIEKQN